MEFLSASTNFSQQRQQQRPNRVWDAAETHTTLGEAISGSLGRDCLTAAINLGEETGRHVVFLGRPECWSWSSFLRGEESLGRVGAHPDNDLGYLFHIYILFFLFFVTRCILTVLAFLARKHKHKHKHTNGIHRLCVCVFSFTTS